MTHPLHDTIGNCGDRLGLRYIDICSGISAPTAAWKPLGWQALCYAEIEAAPRAVLAHHYPDVPLVGDFTQIQGTEYGPVDLLVGGTPCQSFSIAGLRGGLADDRGNLALEYLRLADRARPRWLVWENVPGVLSSGGGRDFGAILGGMAELGYGFAYCVLDAQHFGVPQRRRRVFVVGYLGDWRRAAAVLFERHGLSGHSAPRREKGQNAPTIPSRSTGGGGLGTDFDCDGGLIQHVADIAGTLPAGGNRTGGDRQPGMGQETADTMLISATVSSKWAKGSGGPSGGPSGDECQNLLAVPAAFSIMPMNSGKDYKARETDVAQPIMAGGPVGGNQGGDFICQPVAFDTYNQVVTGEQTQTLCSRGDSPGGNAHLIPAVAFDMRGREGGAQFKGPHDTANIRAASGGSSRSYVAQSAVRRLTPRECERLQGFPDDFTLVPYRGRMMADGPRYKMLGNSMAVPVMRWIGERIARVDALQIKAEAA